MDATDLFKKTDIKRLSAKLAEVEGRSTTRLLSVDDCADHLSHIMRWPISKKALTGTKVIVHATMEKLPNSYGYAANSTKATFTFDGRHWCFVDAERSFLKQKSGNCHCEVFLSDTAKGSICEYYSYY